MNNTKMLSLRSSIRCFGIALGALIILSLVDAARTLRAQSPSTEKVKFNFSPSTGYEPSGLIYSAGNLYVGMGSGGSNLSCRDGCGNILEVSLSGQSTELYAFTPSTGKEGPFPTGLVRDANGTIYGATAAGGRPATYFRGSVIRLTSSGAEKTLYSFLGGDDGQTPEGGLTQAAGNFYGTTYFGGGTGCPLGIGCGVVYKVTPSGGETVLYKFTGGTDGAAPYDSPVLDAAGNLYGTATDGGDLSCSQYIGGGCGTVWKIDTSGNFTVLYTFLGGTDGAGPEAGLVMDSSDNLYGAADEGGNLSCNPPLGCGTIFEISSSGNFTVLHTFTGGSTDGQYPSSTLVRDSSGNLYGTASEGGDLSCSLYGSTGCGVVYKVSSSGNETILHAFTGGTTDGALPQRYQLASDGKGDLYGTTQYGGSASDGVIFAVTAQ
jgi:uncharacterized repeat protein (TIGR03803 family)